MFHKVEGIKVIERQISAQCKNEPSNNKTASRWNEWPHALVSSLLCDQAEAERIHRREDERDHCTGQWIELGDFFSLFLLLNLARSILMGTLTDYLLSSKIHVLSL